jgi:hypothetical protein
MRAKCSKCLLALAPQEKFATTTKSLWPAQDLSTPKQRTDNYDYLTSFLGI